MYTYLKQQFRSIVKHRIISFISIGGFALASAIVILLVAFISSERAYDKDIPEIENIYRVLANDDISDIPEEVAETLVEQFPEVQEASNYYINRKPVTYRDKSYPSKLVCTDDALFRIFETEVIAGTLDSFHKIENQVVLTKSFAKKIFKDENPIGQLVTLSHKNEVVVVAVIEDFPEKRSFNGQVFCSTKLKVTYSSRGWNNKKTYFDKLLVKLHKNASVKDVENRIKPIANAQYHGYADKDYSYVLSPYKHAYFNAVKYDGLKHANVKLIKLLSWLALCIFVFAIINYVNFSVAKISTDLKNVGMHQVLGASKLGLFKRLISEAFFQLVVSGVISIFLTWMLKPLVEGILGQEILFDTLLSSIPYLVSMGLAIVIIAVLAGSYPAYVAMKAKPGLMLKNKIADLQKQRDIRMPLNIIQFAASIVAFVALITIHEQIEFAKNKELGFDTEQLVRINVHYKIKDRVPVLIEKIGGLAGVKNICPTHGTPWAIYSNSSNNEFGRFSQIASNHLFLKTFNVELLDGRNFFDGEKNATALINKKGLEQAGWESFEGKKIFGTEVVGVIDDFHFENLHNEVGALLIRNEDGLSHLNVRMHPGDIAGTMKLVEEEFNKIAGEFNFEYQFYDEWMDTMYRKEENQAKAIQLISILAMLLASLGMLGLAIYSMKRRIKEIGIRKVNGAKVTEILTLLNRDFIKWVAIAFVIACPIAWYAMNKWLENFAYKTSLSWWIFALAGVLALGIALLTVSWQSWKAATRNPVEALRYE
ncbi:ABC transporter permease [uncultured Draconibacterium sp.]|mgnify:CR=1 FL=1|uniref:ABC transporter permease n=1 Tax=uncultured Draconibacterium sp. TaxID=1573823 RepID=UPI0025E8AF4B|nr:ABC transporter permease [uncultured Draconibacterium sp.]